MTAPSYSPSSQAGLASFRESPTEYNARIEQLRAELADIAVQAAVLAERARGLAGVRPGEMAGAA